MAWSLITLDNGFICEFPPNGPGSDAQEDRVLNQDRLGRWQAVLEEFNRIRPDSKAQELAKKWDEGVRGAFDQIAKDDPYKDAKVSADRLLLSEREGDFTREASRVKAILEIGEPEDQKPLSSERRRK
jgi:hypothetical protein